MAYIRQTHNSKCNGKERCGCLWAATVYYGKGSNDRITRSDPSKTVITRWAEDLEADIRRGDFIDPRLAETTVAEAWKRFKGAKHKELASRRRDESHWRVHVEPRWGTVPVGAILKPDVSAWVVELQSAHKDNCPAPARCPGCRVGAATVEGCIKVLRGVLEMAVDARMIRYNPATKIAHRPVVRSQPRVLQHWESQLLLQRLRQLFGDRADGELFVELLLETGMRWEEAAAIPPGAIDTRRHRIQIEWVMERDGTARPYAKSEAGNRAVTYGTHMAQRMTAAKMAALPVEIYPPDPDAPTRAVFTSAEGKALHYSNWLRRVWNPALLGEPTRPAVKQPGRRGPAPKPKGEHYLADPQPTPHDCRHTWGTDASDGGLPQHKVMKLMGHKDRRASDIYIDAGEERFEEAREALDRQRGRASGRRASEGGS